MDDRTDARRLLDLHNISIDSMPPVGIGLCGFTHLERPHLPATAPAPGGPCQLQDQRQHTERLAGFLQG